jgi:tRNA 2-thiouridine synthesizing protein A
MSAVKAGCEEESRIAKSDGVQYGDSVRECLIAVMTDQDCHALWDAADMGCGELLILLRGRLNAMQAGQILKLIATDPGAVEDIPSWCRLTGHKLIEANHPEYLIERRS